MLPETFVETITVLIPKLTALGMMWLKPRSLYELSSSTTSLPMSLGAKAEEDGSKHMLEACLLCVESGFIWNGRASQLTLYIT